MFGGGTDMRFDAVETVLLVCGLTVVSQILIGILEVRQGQKIIHLREQLLSWNFLASANIKTVVFSKIAHHKFSSGLPAKTSVRLTWQNLSDNTTVLLVLATSSAT